MLAEQNQGVSMTTEDDFQRQLDEHPDDHHTRLVFADWLQDRDDPRAEGYRALGIWRVIPFACELNDYQKQLKVKQSDVLHFYGKVGEDVPGFLDCRIPVDWFDVVDGMEIPERDSPSRQNRSKYERIPRWIWIRGRRCTEDAAALAFSKLPPERRAELLKGKQS